MYAILAVALITVFIALVAFGHVLLITAFWTRMVDGRPEPHHDTVAGVGQHLPQPK